MYVHKNIKDKFVSELVASTKNIRVGDPLDDDTTMGAMISQSQALKVLKYVETAEKEVVAVYLLLFSVLICIHKYSRVIFQGGKVLCGGERVIPSEEFENGWFVSPCVIDGVTDNMTVAREEIFGPVISLLTFEDENDVIKRANDSQFGLAAGVFTKYVQQVAKLSIFRQ